MEGIKPGGMRAKSDLEAAIRSEGRAVLIVNTRSRRGRRLFRQARTLLGEAGLRFLEEYPVEDPTRMPEIFAAALRHEPDLVVVGGGDGTVAEAVGHLASRDVALGVLPLGTTNNFARSLELPMSLPGAVSVLRDGKVADVDLGSVGGKVFANMVSLGLSVQVAEYVPHTLKRVIGRAAYVLTALRLLPGHQAFEARLRIGDDAYELRTHQLNIANGAHHSGRRIARDASPDDRLLAVYRLGDEARLRLAGATLRHVLTGHRRTLAEDAFLTTGEVHIETEPPLQVDVDGEIRGRTPVTVTLVPNALRVFVPQTFIDT